MDRVFREWHDLDYLVQFFSKNKDYVNTDFWINAGAMKFNIKKMKEVSRPMTQVERQEMDYRNENRNWLTMSAKFALLVRQILRTEKMTQTELAARMGVSCVQITKILSGKENIGLQTIAKVEKALGRSLVTFQESPASSNSLQIDPTFNQTFSLPVSYAMPESLVMRTQDSEIFSKLSTGKILV